MDIVELIDSEIMRSHSRLVELCGLNGLRVGSRLSHVFKSNLRNPLIISTGDISDVDGFFALAKYAKSGADVLFIMNYPAFLDPEMSGKQEGSANDGLGFNFSVESFLNKSYEAIVSHSKMDTEKIDMYHKVLEAYHLHDAASENDRQTYVKGMFTDLGFVLAKKVWEHTIVDGYKGSLYFCVGGINSISPFSAGGLNELFVYASHLLYTDNKLQLSEKGTVYNEEGKIISIDYVFSSHVEYFIDFNGSMAFFQGTVKNKILAHVKQIKGVFVMGGVLSWEKSRTMPKINDKLNRFSCATMNQLYSPSESSSFFYEMGLRSVPMFVVTNNVVHDLTNEKKTLDGLCRFLRENDICSEFLEGLAFTYYNSYHAPPVKAFDFYVALALTEFMKNGMHRGTIETMYYDAKYGICMIGHRGLNWESARKNYFELIDTIPDDSDTGFIASKKRNYLNEMTLLSTYNSVLSTPVRNVDFELSPEFKLSIKF